MSIETGMPEVPRFAMFSGCVLEQINWQMQRSGLLTAAARLVTHGKTVGVHRKSFWNQERRKLRGRSAHLVGLIMRRAGCDASGAFRASSV